MTYSLSRLYHLAYQECLLLKVFKDYEHFNQTDPSFTKLTFFLIYYKALELKSYKKVRRGWKIPRLQKQVVLPPWGMHNLTCMRCMVVAATQGAYKIDSMLACIL